MRWGKQSIDILTIMKSIDILIQFVEFSNVKNGVKAVTPPTRGLRMEWMKTLLGLDHSSEHLEDLLVWKEMTMGDKGEFLRLAKNTHAAYMLSQMQYA